MRIQDAYRQSPTSTDATAARPTVGDGKQGPTAAPAEGGGAPVTVTLSDKARELSSQSSSASAEKVARLQQSIAAGTFKIDSGAIASKIVEGD